MHPSTLAIRFYLLLLMLGSSLYGFAQQTPLDTLPPQPPQVSPPKPMLRTPDYQELILTPAQAAGLPDPRKSAFLSTIMPGLGQIYNGALWKVPLVYAGGAVVVYSVNFYNMRYSESLRMLRILRFQPNNPPPDARPEAFYNRAVEFYRRQRDFTIILGGAFYALQIAETYVDAHLQTFRLDDELSMRVMPTLIPGPTGLPVAGIRITYTLP